LDSQRIAAFAGRIAGKDNLTSTDQFGESLQAYALGALDGAERDALEAHLATGCPECAAELAEARWVVSQLAYAAPAAAPAGRLRGRVMQMVRSEAATARTSLTAISSSKPAVPFWMWAGVAALLLLTLYSAWNARQLQEQIRDVNERATAQLHGREKIEQELAAARQEAAQVKREADILADPASVRIAMATSAADSGSLQANWNPRLGLVVSGSKIPQPAGSRVLQLWIIPKRAGAKPVPVQVERPDANGSFVMVVANPPEALTDAKALAVSEEPAGGSAQPTTTPKWVGGVSLFPLKSP
jgi:anti-sigma-K factor RskA